MPAGFTPCHQISDPGGDDKKVSLHPRLLESPRAITPVWLRQDGPQPSVCGKSKHRGTLSVVPLKSHIFLTFVQTRKYVSVMLRILAIFILIYLIFRIIFTFVLPRVARWYLNRYRKRFYRENPEAAEAAEKQKKSREYYAQKEKAKKPDTDQLGEYVDFEEIEDKDENTGDQEHKD